jgi:hypothetical protein
MCKGKRHYQNNQDLNDASTGKNSIKTFIYISPVIIADIVNLIDVSAASRPASGECCSFYPLAHRAKE